MRQETWGNGAVQSVEFNSRLQPTVINLDKSGNLLQRYEYKYGQVNIETGAPDTLNNGQIGRVDAFVGRDALGSPVKAWEQRYSYDAVGRLSRAREVRSDTGASVWQQHFTYDRYGNRFQAPAGTPGNYNEGLPWLKVEASDVNPATNRYTLPQISYNAAGQMTQNTYHRNSRYTYDAGGRVRSWMRPDLTNLRTNVMDGAGQRVMVFNDTSWRHILWDVFGRIVAEYTTGAGAEMENIYRGAGSAPLVRRATSSGVTSVKWELTDVQGSVRLLTDGQGAATERYDYTPFGESLTAGTGTRTLTQGYSSGVQLRHRFAGMTNDYTATTLEDTPWRKMDSKAGRWTTPDPYLGSMSVGDPQSFNRYAYVQNDPVNLIDPSGLNASDGSSGGCSAEYSYSECGGDSGFWGGSSGGGFDGGFGYGFGDGRAMYHDLESSGTPASSLPGLLQYEYNVNNAFYGGGINELSYGGQSWYDGMGTITSYGSLAWHQRGVLGPIGDYSRGVANSVIPFGIVDRIHQSRGEPTPDSAAYQAGSGSGVVLGMVVPGGQLRGLNVTVKGLAHVFNRHLAGGALSAGKSLFSSRIDVVALIRGAANITPVRQPGGNFERIVNAGRVIGTDRTTGQPTRIFTVITRTNGDLVTAFPGRP